ncbi:MAG: sugar phosphate isomerase/epimerase [Pirellula sp.]|jgi:sugar phosphate isomerase/epimerase|nr:sugar phosphate isomerase/epimerase [Pirellula sp.]
MKFAICNETFGEWPIERGFELATKYGYTGIEVAPFTLGTDALSISPAVRSNYKRVAESFGLQVIGLHWLLAKTSGFHLTTQDAEVRARTATYLQELVRLCHDLGGQVMVLGSPLQRNFPPEMGHDQAMQNAAQVLEFVVPTLEQFGVRLAIEPLGPQEGNFLNHAHQARELIRIIGSPHVQLHLDVKAMSSEGPPIADIIRENADLLIHYHANDPNRLGPGMGQVDHAPLFRALREIDYQGWVSVEVFDYSPGVERILSESMANMKAAIQKSFPSSFS